MSDLPFWLDVAAGLGDALGGLATLGALWLAWRTIPLWRDQKRDEKRAEVAHDLARKVNGAAEAAWASLNEAATDNSRPLGEIRERFWITYEAAMRAGLLILAELAVAKIYLRDNEMKAPAQALAAINDARNAVERAYVAAESTQFVDRQTFFHAVGRARDSVSAARWSAIEALQHVALFKDEGVVQRELKQLDAAYMFALAAALRASSIRGKPPPPTDQQAGS